MMSPTDSISKLHRDYWSMTEGVWNCLIDQERTHAFSAAIRDLVRPGDTVVDAGTGTGVLAMVAAKAGAKKVFAIENDPKNALFLSKTFAVNNLEEICAIINADATTCDLPEPVDVIICEMVATGMIEELQFPAMRNLLRFAKPGYRVVLQAMTHRVQLVHSNQEHYGFRFPIPRYEYPDEAALQSHPLSDAAIFASVDFSMAIEDLAGVRWAGSLKCGSEGLLNGLRITTDSKFGNGTLFGASSAYAYPVVLPVEPMAVSIRDCIKVEISYPYSGGFERLEYSITKANKK